jgi:hypothetical protein
MAGCKIPRPEGSSGTPVDINDGTLCRQASPRPGILCSHRLDTNRTLASLPHVGATVMGTDEPSREMLMYAL